MKQDKKGRQSTHTLR